MIKFREILREAKRVQLPSESLSTLRNVVDLIFKKRLTGFKKYTPITELPIIIADGTPGTVEIAVDPNMDYYAIIDDKKGGDGKTEPDDFIIIVNPKKVQSRKGLYQTLYHEIMHATDPNFSTKYSEKYWSSYDIESNEGYYGHMAEFRAFTNEFLEGLVNEFVSRRSKLKNERSILKLKESLSNILNYFAKNEPLNSLSEDILDKMMGKESGHFLGDFLSKMKGSNLYSKLSKHIEPSEDETYIDILNNLKEYNPNEWRRFLGMLYKTIEEIEEKIN